MNSKFLLTAVTLTLSALGLFLLTQPPKKLKAFTKSSILKLLSDLHTSLKPCCLKIAIFANTVKSNSPSPLSPSQLFQILINDFSITDLIVSAKYPIYTSWETTESELNIHIKALNDDLEVQNSSKALKDSIENACLGFVLSETCKIPFELTSQQALEILSEVYNCELYFGTVKRRMTIDVGQEIDDWEIEAKVFDEENLCKVKVFERFGVKVQEGEVNEVIRQTVENFGIIDEEFKGFHRKLEEMFRQHLKGISNGELENGFREHLERKYRFYMGIERE